MVSRSSLVETTTVSRSPQRSSMAISRGTKVVGWLGDLYLHQARSLPSASSFETFGREKPMRAPTSAW